MIIDRLFMASKEPSLYQNKKVGLIAVAGGSERAGLMVPIMSLLPLVLGMEIVDLLRASCTGPGLVLLQGDDLDRSALLGKRIVMAIQGHFSPDDTKDKNVCPICRSNFVQIKEDGVLCPVCGVKGKLEKSTILWNANSEEDNLWTEDASMRFFGDHSEKAKDLFLSKRKELAELKQRYKDKNYDFGWVKVPVRVSNDNS